VKVELLDENDSILPGYSQAECVPLTGNSITQAVTWTAHSELPANQPYLKLRFILQNASVYSFMTGSNAALVEVPPTLDYTRQDSNLILSWPTNFVGFTLEYAATLPPATWTVASPPPVIVGGQYVATNSLGNGERHYRLRKP